MALDLSKKQPAISGVVRRGDRFIFVMTTGERRDYVVVAVEGEVIEQTPPMYAQLRRVGAPEDSPVAWATLKWLTDGELRGRTYWLRAEEQQAAA